jgi:hypothetical protein
MSMPAKTPWVVTRLPVDDVAGVADHGDVTACLEGVFGCVVGGYPAAAGRACRVQEQCPAADAGGPCGGLGDFADPPGDRRAPGARPAAGGSSRVCSGRTRMPKLQRTGHQPRLCVERRSGPVDFEVSAGGRGNGVQVRLVRADYEVVAAEGSSGSVCEGVCSARFIAGVATRCGKPAAQAIPEALSGLYPGVRNRSWSWRRRMPVLLPSMTG